MMHITKADRQARTTTDFRFTAIRTEAPGTACERTYYVCRGCGKTSYNGGSYGFHVRACTKLDRIQVDSLRIAELKAEATAAGSRDWLDTAAEIMFGVPLNTLSAAAVETVAGHVLRAEGARGHLNVMGGGALVCRSCNGVTFWDAGRSLYHENLVCANTHCRREASPLTETGACQ